MQVIKNFRLFLAGFLFVGIFGALVNAHEHQWEPVTPMTSFDRFGGRNYGGGFIKEAARTCVGGASLYNL